MDLKGWCRLDRNLVRLSTTDQVHLLPTWVEMARLWREARNLWIGIAIMGVLLLVHLIFSHSLLGGT